MGSGQSTAYLSAKDKLMVVVVGGGFAGVDCAARLKDLEIPFVLIDPKEFFHHNVAGLRASVFPDFTHQTMIDYSKSFGHSFVQGKVTRVDPDKNTVTLETGREIRYTHLVIATGSKGPFPSRTRATNMKACLDEYQSIHREIQSSKHIVIIGGGATGVELSGELRDDPKNNDKKITLIHSGDALLQYGYGNKFEQGALDQLKAKNVNVMLNSRVENLKSLNIEKCEPQTIQIKNGEAFEADLVFVCIGLRTETELTKESFGHKLDENGRLKVNPKLMVDGHMDIFAIGDSCNTKENKMAAHAMEHGKVVANNIDLELRNKDMKDYKQKFDGMTVTIGRHGGVGFAQGFNLPKCLIPIAKGKTLFTEMEWKTMKQTAPRPN